MVFLFVEERKRWGLVCVAVDGKNSIQTEVSAGRYVGFGLHFVVAIIHSFHFSASPSVVILVGLRVSMKEKWP